MLDFDALLGAPMLEAFGVRVLYARADEPPFTVRAIFDRAALEGFASDGAAITTRRAQLTLRLAELPPGFPPMQADLVQIALRGDQAVDYAVPPPAGAVLEAFEVADVQPDGAGCALLILGARAVEDLA